MTYPIVALDVRTLPEAQKLLTELQDTIHFYKVGLRLFTAEGARAVRLVDQMGGKVFLDLKLHDIPQTVAHAVEEAGRLGVHSVSLHLSGGREMLRAAVRAQPRPKLWGVSVLTSLDQDDLKVLGGRKPAELVRDLAGLAVAEELDGVVCSGEELPIVSKLKPRPAIIVPGVRGAADKVGDQKRVVTPAEAAKRGADYIVVGRPITQAADPKAAAQRIIKELEEAQDVSYDPRD